MNAPQTLSILGWLGACYAAAGAIFALAFAARGAARIDPAATHSTLGFRLIIIPAAAALWPLLVWRWAFAGRPPRGAA